jgi:hypothetical protein
MYANLWQEISAHLGDQEWIKAHKIDLSKWQGARQEAFFDCPAVVFRMFHGSWLLHYSNG